MKNKKRDKNWKEKYERIFNRKIPRLKQEIKIGMNKK